MHRTILSLLSVVVLLSGFTAAARGASPQAEAKQVLDASGVRVGLCVHLGSGSESCPELTAALAAETPMLVHGLAPDAASLARARKGVETRGLLGQAMVEMLPLDPLPHVCDLASLVVIEDFSALATKGLKMEEVQRITRPGGVICAKKEGRWTKSVKPRPAEMDDWPHPQHGADGNAVSNDRLVKFPVGLRWQDGVPMNFNLWAACRGWVLADGRLFTLGTTELENLGPASFSKHKKQEYLTARDAFSGLPLWKVNCETVNDGQALNAHNTIPLVTDGECVYVYRGKELVALDAASGQVKVAYPVKYPSARLLLAQGAVISAGWEAKEESKDGERPALWSHWVSKTGKAALEAFDKKDGSRKWSLDLPALEILAGDGLIYALVQSGNPPTQQQVLALDLQTGQQRWQIAHDKLSPTPALHLGYAGSGILVVARTKAKAISVLDSKDGKPLWEINPTQSFWTPMVNGLLWHGNKKYDPKTGQVKGTLPAGVGSGLCTPSAVVGNYVTASRGGNYLELHFADDTKPKGVTRIHYGAIRGACIEGATPANGMFYTAQNFCRCTPGQVPGFVAFGPNGDPPTPADFAKARPIEQGPAFGAAREGGASPADWPTYRHDAQRSGATNGKLPAKLTMLWQTKAARPAEGPLAGAWKARLTGCVTAPVVGEGRVFVAAVDAGQVVAFDAASGKPAWRTTVGARIDTPPTIDRGLCLFGSHDGWVYALRADDGQLAWRARVAPWERRMVAFGQVESVWPALGSVLVHDGVAFASAGRTCESDGGVAVCALDPQTGRQLWGSVIGPGPARQNDLLALRGGKLVMHHVEIDPKTGKCQAGKPDPQGSLEGLIDGSWTRLGTRRSGHLVFGRAAAELFASNSDTLFGYECRPRACFSLPLAKTPLIENPKDKNANKLDPKDYTWRVGLPADHQAEAMALCADGLLLAGKVCDPKTEGTSGFLCAVSLADGKRIVEQALDFPPAYDGLAMANNRVYLSDQAGRVTCFGSAP